MARQAQAKVQNQPAFGTHLKEAAALAKEWWNRPSPPEQLMGALGVAMPLTLTSGLQYTLASSHENAVSYNAADVLKSSGGLRQ